MVAEQGVSSFKKKKLKWCLTLLACVCELKEDRREGRGKWKKTAGGAGLGQAQPQVVTSACSCGEQLVHKAVSHVEGSTLSELAGAPGEAFIWHKDSRILLF